MMRIRLPLLSLASFFAIASVVFANGLILNGITPRSIGRGGTDIAHSDTSGVILDNPAGAANIEGDNFVEAGVTMLFTDFGYSDARRSGTTSEFAPLPDFGFIKKNGDWAYGLGVFAPAGLLERYRMEGSAAFPGTQKYFSIGALGKILPTVAYNVNDRLSIGATLGVAISHEEIEGPYTLQGPSVLRGTPTLLDLQATGAALCWSIGMQYKLTDITTFGLTYQSESSFSCHGPTNVTVPGLGTCRYDTAFDIIFPQSVGAGIRHELCPHRIVSVDVVWYNWANAFNNMDITLTNPSVGYFPSIVEQLPLNWRDSVSTKFGFEQVLSNGHVARCGYIYNNNPVPNGTLSPYIQATLEHSMTLGYGLNVKGWDLDFSYMYCFTGDRHVDTSELAGGDFSNSIQRAQCHSGAFSFSKKY